MIKLTQSQQDLLDVAADAADGAVDTPADRKAYAALIKGGLAIPLPLADGRTRLLITEAGRAAIGARAAELAAHAEPELGRRSYAGPLAPTGKIGTVVELLRRPEGATIDAMMVATGWQAHSVRGALSGSVKKKLGLTVASAKTDGARVYRIPEAGA